MRYFSIPAVKPQFRLSCKSTKIPQLHLDFLPALKKKSHEYVKIFLMVILMS